MKEFIRENPGWTFLIVVVLCETVCHLVRGSAF
jgi:hypothetical protein